MSIKMPKCAYHICNECGKIAEYYYNEYGTTEPCDYCSAPPIALNKVIVTRD
jgi:hypothetical protein